ncbi:radical SAM protein [Acrocarpospora sp. B8E8]|uniref:radical SAM protein n=1 Tax=Acrocarpospora sp. B8E8 TaxID=3153572 RepID=UPI00325E65EE
MRKLTVAEFREAFDPAALNLFILPTEQCNFRCTYCYEDFKLGQMKREVVAGIKALLSTRLPSLRALGISWFGGEPLLAMPVIEEISEHILSLKASAAHTLNYQASITTNGYRLNIPTVQRLVELGVTEAQVSLDGLAEVHDRTRVRRDGAGTFDRIWANLLAIRDSNISFNVILRVHFSPENYSTLNELVASLNSNFSGDSRFKVFFKGIAHLGGANDQNIPVFSGAQARSAKEALAELIDTGVVTLGDVSGGGICYAAKPNSLVIRSNGVVGKCTVALYDERNAIGRIAEDGELDIHQEMLRPWLTGFQSHDSGMLSCPYGAMSKQS